MIGKYRIEIAGCHYGEFAAANSAVQFLLKKGWFHPDEKNGYYKLKLEVDFGEFEACIIFVPVPCKLSDLPKKVLG